MATLQVRIEPGTPISSSVTARSRGVVHYREIVFEDDNGDIISREASVSIDVSPEFTGLIQILDYVPETSINVSLVSSQGMVILSSDVERPDPGATDNDFVFVWTLGDQDVEEVISLIEREPLYSAILRRQGLFVSIGFPAPPFAKYELMISLWGSKNQSMRKMR